MVQPPILDRDDCEDNRAASRPESRLFRKLHRPHFDEAADCERRDATGDGDGFVTILALDQVVAAKLLLGLSEWPIGGQRLAVFLAHGDCGGARIEFCPAEQLTALFEFMDELAVVAHDPVAPGIRKLHPLGLFNTTQEQELHDSLQMQYVTWTRPLRSSHK